MSTSTPHVLRARAYALIAEAHTLLSQAETIAAGDDRNTYTSRPGDEPIAWHDRHRAWREIIATIPGAQRMHARSRWWTVSREDYDAWAASRPGAHVATPAPANDPAPEPWTPAAAFASVGLRRTK